MKKLPLPLIVLVLFSCINTSSISNAKDAKSITGNKNKVVYADSHTYNEILIEYTQIEKKAEEILVLSDSKKINLKVENIKRESKKIKEKAAKKRKKNLEPDIKKLKDKGAKLDKILEQYQ